jgi:NitT/TauT family transport system permease protein
MVSRPDDEERLDAELAGLDALDTAVSPVRGRVHRLWSSLWPKLAALGIVLFLWQVLVWSHWKPDYALAGPGPTFRSLWHDLSNGVLPRAIGVTMRRAAVGYSLAVAIGVLVGIAVARIPVLRAAIGSLITGLQTMPSIAWFPLAILIFTKGEGPILFVVVIGAAPSIANGLLSGIDHVPPLLTRAGRVLGAEGFTAYRHVILPAAFPSFLGGLKQGWAFAWRSLMAGELLVVVAGQRSIGTVLDQSRQFTDSAGIIAAMIVILVIGIVVDSLVFGVIERRVRRRWGLVDSAT